MVGGAKMTEKAMVAAKWFAHALGVTASLFFLAFFIGEGARGFIAGGGIPGDLLLFLALLAAAVAGCIAAFFNAGAGGLLQLSGGIAMAAYHIVAGGVGDIGTAAVFGVPYIACGCIFLAIRHVKKPRLKNAAA